MIRIAVVDGSSMAPTLRDGDRVLVRRTRRVRRGDITLIAMPAGWILKRVTGLPGDAGVPPGTYHVLGDNADASIDSREFGCVPAAWVYGVVVRLMASSSKPVSG
ncbi:S26 family signal peptidase [Virgisporangium ochraceum]|uniref:S26 family signal peptidase n=1 Tax=Virgisporangium ochraceum TaxID=65505 RepID=A0A8J4EI50_9ACTN|nr:S26 family signal peptidase [Virgisporangium ochraceum]GIJ75371.1 S26 family signal peptidase [Virgisporangium ochraceum]